jgi:hypothetical protein
MTVRTVQYDSIDSLSCLGYSEREATFLYMVALHSGYFLRRQFNRVVKRHLGSAAAGFLAKAKRAGRVREIQCGAGRLLYQLHAKQLYRIVGLRNSQNRRAKSSLEIRRRLIMLDYILSHLGKEEFLDSEAAREKFFAQFGVKTDGLVSARTFAELLPVSVRRADGNLTVRFPFIDEGQRSTAKFERFLTTHDKLFCSLPSFEVVYVAITPEHFQRTRQLFRRSFPVMPPTNLKISSPIVGQPIVGQLSLARPRAAVVTELIKETYPLLLNSAPVHGLVQGAGRQYIQTPLFFSAVANDAV